MTAIPAILPAAPQSTTQAADRSVASADRQADIEARKQNARSKAEEFESVFLKTFVEQMFAGIKTDGPFTGGSAEGIYRSMMSDQYAKTLAKSGGIGLADHMYAEILKTQHIEP